MPELPRVTASQIIAVLEKQSFVCVRQSGSHKIFKKRDGKRATVPFHGARILHPKVLKNILKDANISVIELQELL